MLESTAIVDLVSHVLVRMKEAKSAQDIQFCMVELERVLAVMAVAEEVQRA